MKLWKYTLFLWDWNRHKLWGQKHFVRLVGTGGVCDVCGKFESGGDGEFGLEVISEVGSRDVISVGKDVKGGVILRLDDIVC